MMMSTFRDSQGILRFYIGLLNSLNADFVSLSAMKLAVIMLNVVRPSVSWYWWLCADLWLRIITICLILVYFHRYSPSYAILPLLRFNGSRILREWRFFLYKADFLRINKAVLLQSKSRTLGPDRLQRDRLALYVIAQQYHFHLIHLTVLLSPTMKNSERVLKMLFLVLFKNFQIFC